MKIDNSFVVDLPVAQAWTLLLDIPAVVPCMPGATLLAVEDERTYRGQVTVKLGPVTMTFQGRARLDAVDEAARTVRVKASGNEMKGRGSAQADVTFSLQPAGPGTRVTIATDVALAGSVAQYGRAQGVIADVAQAVIDTFAQNLRARIAAVTPTTEDTPAAARAADSTAPIPPAAALSLWSVLIAVMWRWLGRLTGTAR